VPVVSAKTTLSGFWGPRQLGTLGTAVQDDLLSMIIEDSFACAHRKGLVSISCQLQHLRIIRQPFAQVATSCFFLRGHVATSVDGFERPHEMSIRHTLSPVHQMAIVIEHIPCHVCVYFPLVAPNQLDTQSRLYFAVLSDSPIKTCYVLRRCRAKLLINEPLRQQHEDDPPSPPGDRQWRIAPHWRSRRFRIFLPS